MKIVLPSVLLLLLVAVQAQAFPKETMGSRKCTECHTLSVMEAGTLLQGGVDRVLSVEPAEIPGFWMVEVEKDRQRFPLFVDFTKRYLVTGNVIRLSDRQNITSERQAQMNKVNVAAIPLDDALLLGRADAPTKVILFTDPECSFCKRLHGEIKEVVRREPGIAFQIKMFPLRIHPNAYTTSKSIVCAKSMAMLEASYEGKPVPPPTCDTKAVDENLALVERLGIRSTPTLVLPNGLVAPGYKTADDLIRLIKANSGK